jgi:DNA helicase-4
LDELLLVIILLALSMGFVAMLLGVNSQHGERERAELARRLHELLEARRDLVALERDGWLAHSPFKRWREHHADLLRVLRPPADDSEAAPLPHWHLLGAEERASGLEAATYLAPVVRDGQRWRTHRNNAWLDDALERNQEWFDNVLSWPLHEDQRRAILINEDNNLVMAAAGTGKTATLTARIAWAIQSRDTPADQILALAYNRKAAKELGERLEGLGIDGVECSTFHALGKRIIRSSTGRDPPVSRLADSDHERRQFLREAIVQLLKGSETFSALVRWFSSEFLELNRGTAGSGSSDDPRAGGGLSRTTRSRDGLLTIDGREVRSRSEVHIANWLTLHGIAWEYEREYRPDGQQPGGRVYRPDFYLPEHELWLEHWGITRGGRGSPEVNVRRYQLQIEWKRELHRTHGTTLLETWHEDIVGGAAPDTLARLMREHDIAMRRLTAGEFEEIAGKRRGAIPRFIDLLGQFLSLFKSGSHTWAGVAEGKSTHRGTVFLQLFRPVFEAYEARLQSEEAIDFDDMIVQARRLVDEGRFAGPWTQILVDEFQDASATRLGLVLALRHQHENGRLFVVGDDWQSIYRFAGSDLSLFLDHEEQLGVTKRTDLTQTWRLLRSVAHASATFVTRNPAQLEKEVRPRPGTSDDNGVRITWVGIGERNGQGITIAFDDILSAQAESESGINQQPDVLVLARYRFVLEQDDVRTALRRYREKGLNITSSTVHAAKGLEADHVVVLDMVAGIMGFPSEISDDPLLDMVLAEPDPHPYGEERRLFYVAMTRTRNRCYLVAPSAQPSPFIKELLESPSEFVPDVLQIGIRAPLHRCAECLEVSVVRVTKGPYSDYWACSRHPACDGRLRDCPVCEGAPLVPVGDPPFARFECSECGEGAVGCPECGRGHKLERSGRYGTFWSCSSWRQDGTGCDYKFG